MANNIIAHNAGDAISEGGAHPVLNTFAANTYFGNGADRIDDWGDSVEDQSSSVPVAFVGATEDDYRRAAAGPAGTRIGAPAIDFLGRPSGRAGRGAYRALSEPDRPRAPGSPGTLPTSAVGAPRHPRWPRDAAVGSPYRSGPGRGIALSVRLPRGRMTVRATATARRLGRLATAERTNVSRGSVRMHLRPARDVARALAKAAPVSVRVEVVIEAGGLPPARSCAP